MRIAIVNDMAMAAEALRRVLVSVPGYELAWIATDGEEAVRMCKIDTPDLILMDLVMPVMDGAETTRQIMAKSPCAILVVTATVDGHSSKVFEALGAGALDAVQTPTLTSDGNLDGVLALKFKIDSIGRSALNDRACNPTNRGITVVPQLPSTNRDFLVAIGASAGGPAALATILSGLPHDFPGAIIIIQHLDAQFAPSLAEWLNDRSSVPVRIARPGDKPQAKIALLAGTNDHLVFVDGRSLAYAAEPRDSHYRPSIDVFFESIVRHWRKGAAIGILLTGMGRDGAKGLKAMRESGCLTIAQNAATCVVYGMPKAAIELEAAVKVLPIDEIATGLTDLAGSIKTGCMSRSER